jgi:drug/metabolite transporter (DMT)-like permease
MSPSRPVANQAGSPSAVAVWIALAVVYVIWGSTYLGIRIVAESLPAFGSAATRFAIAGVLLGTILAVVKGWRALRVTWRQLLACSVVGILLLAGGNGLVVLAEGPGHGVPSGVAALIISLNPLIMVVLRATTGDRPRLWTVLGVVVGLVGLAALFLPGLPGLGGGGGDHAVPIVGGLLCLTAVTCWCIGSFATRWLPMPQDPFVASVYEMLWGAASMTSIALVLREPAVWAVPDVPAKAWWALAYLVTAGSLVAFTAYIWLLHNAPISLVSTYAYVNPVIALILGAALAAEVLTGQVILASATVLVGVVLVVTTETRRKRAENRAG